MVDKLNICDEDKNKLINLIIEILRKNYDSI